MSFDITASNTGLTQGGARIERELRQTLWLACRHHIHELILRRVFEKCCSLPLSGPDIQILREFQSLWATLDKKSYTIMLDKETPIKGLKGQCVTIINYFQNALKGGSHPREDYKELLQLSLFYLGGWAENDFSFKIPGALHQVVWMAKAIYPLKLVLF